jgi:hypothetical protein
MGTLTHTIQAQPRTLPLASDRLATELARVFIAYLGVQPTTTKPQHLKATRRIPR